ncbi:hypothetical protein [Hymenobacter persicinus]|uniref:Lipocalin-like domain-containing protein n=1 Tax=Hymenobacter persicinus TaxID=2025506 RepID=A0A4Q5LFL6_9BACT|nr:hypothetical protein [Hymenobacter persicinus]RYU79708.1 hypothetical protein EWM57_09870 [Hymenobacter persicinus]
MRAALLLLLSPLLLASCHKEADSVAPALFETQIMGRTWVESVEEEQPGSDVRLFRPETSLRPGLSPRNSFRFDAEGVFTGHSPSAVTEGGVVYPGRWLMEPNNTLRILPARAGRSFGFQIISLRDSLLQLRRLP